MYIYIYISGSQLEGSGGRSPLPFFENGKKCPDFGKKALILSILGLNFRYIYTLGFVLTKFENVLRSYQNS